MRFTSSATPTLTPLGVRLMNLSRSKLVDLEPPVGGRDTAHTLLRGVLVREAVRSAWASLESGPSELTDWRAPTALGLDTLAEEDEEDEEAAEAAWLDDVLSTFESDDDSSSVDVDESAWAETTVSRPDEDDFDYDDDAIQAFTLPSMSSTAMDIEEADALVAHALAADTTTDAADSANADVTVVEVSAVNSDSDSEYSDYEDMQTSWLELDSSSDRHDDEHAKVQGEGTYSHIEDMDLDDTASDASSDSLVTPTSEDPSVAAVESLDDNSLEATRTPSPAIVDKKPDTNTLLLAIPPSPPSRPSLSRGQPFFVTEFDVLDLAPIGDVDVDELECPDLVGSSRRRYAHCAVDRNDCDDCDDCDDEAACSDVDSDDDDDDCPCRTPPLMSCEDLEQVAPTGKRSLLWNDEGDLNLDALTI